MMQTQAPPDRALAVVDATHVREVALETTFTHEQALDRWRDLRRFVDTVMTKGEDYGTIPGTKKPTLYQPGAEKLLELYGLGLGEPQIRRQEDFERGFWFYEVMLPVIKLKTGQVISYGVGSANSMEERYRWRKETSYHQNSPCSCYGPHAQLTAEDEQEEPCRHGWKPIVFRRSEKVPRWERRKANDARWDLVNTILKIAFKRAKVAVTLSVTRSSGLFTQDLEDLDSVRDDLAANEPVGYDDPPMQARPQQRPANRQSAPPQNRAPAQQRQAPAKPQAPTADLEAAAAGMKDKASIEFLAYCNRIKGAAEMAKLEAIRAELTKIREAGKKPGVIGGPRGEWLGSLIKRQRSELDGTAAHPAPQEAETAGSAEGGSEVTSAAVEAPEGSTDAPEPDGGDPFAPSGINAPDPQASDKPAEFVEHGEDDDDREPW